MDKWEYVTGTEKIISQWVESLFIQNLDKVSEDFFLILHLQNKNKTLHQNGEQVTQTRKENPLEFYWQRCELSDLARY